MRTLISLAAIAMLVTGCSQQNDDEDAAGFVPPTNQTRADYATNLDARFGRLDSNRNGVIEVSEVRRPERIKMLDKDGSGDVIRDEFVATNLARFDTADANRDAILSSQERAASGLFRNAAATPGTAAAGNATE